MWSIYCCSASFKELLYKSVAIWSCVFPLSEDIGSKYLLSNTGFQNNFPSDLKYENSVKSQKWKKKENMTEFYT